MKRALLAAALVGIAAAVAVSTGSAAPPKLIGTVGPGFTIKLTKGGARVKTLKAGKYTFVISDKSSNHSYALDGPKGFAKDFTTIPFKGTKRVTLTLKKGKYKFYCANHESIMFGHFTVT